jgi:polyribonucleotide 5'-hydroxyl-kinase
LRKERINEYFYGPKCNLNGALALSPSRVDLPLSKIVIIRQGGVQISAALRPIGSDKATDDTTLTSVRPSPDLLHHILAVLHPSLDSSDDSDPDISTVPSHLMKSNIGGFLYVCAVDMEQDIITVTAPCPCSPDTLPSRYCLIGSVKWVE